MADVRARPLNRSTYDEIDSLMKVEQELKHCCVTDPDCQEKS